MSVPEFPVPSADLRNGKLSAGDQRKRDAMIAERYLAGQPIGEIADAFLLGYVTVWNALRRQNVRISMRQAALFREQRRRQRETA